MMESKNSDLIDRFIGIPTSVGTQITGGDRFK